VAAHHSGRRCRTALQEGVWVLVTQACCGHACLVAQGGCRGALRFFVKQRKQRVGVASGRAALTARTLDGISSCRSRRRRRHFLTQRGALRQAMRLKHRARCVAALYLFIDGNAAGLTSTWRMPVNSYKRAA